MCKLEAQKVEVTSPNSSLLNSRAEAANPNAKQSVHSVGESNTIEYRQTHASLISSEVCDHNGEAFLRHKIYLRGLLECPSLPYGVKVSTELIMRLRNCDST